VSLLQRGGAFPSGGASELVLQQLDALEGAAYGPTLLDA
jgi:hypothetical protein